MSFSAFPAATCSSLPPAMRKPPALSFQSERKAFAASGRAAVNIPSGRRVLRAGAGLAADGFAPGIASPMPPEEVTRTSGGFDGQGFDRDGTGLCVKMQAIEGERPYPDGGRTGVLPGLAVGGGKAVAAPEGQCAHRGFGTGDGEGGC